MAAATSSCSRSGFAYIAVLLLLAGLGFGALQVAENSRTTVQREAEAQLLFAGRQYRSAIEAYMARPPGAAPRRLEDLLDDRRSGEPVRHLRRLYPDPFTGAADWQLVRDATGGVMGVHSRSRVVPLQRRGFAASEASFASAAAVGDWHFVAGRGGDADRPATLP